MEEKENKMVPSIEQIINRLRETNADGLDVNAHPLIDKTFVDTLRSNNFSFCIWTVNDLETATCFKKLGVDAITTDNPELLKKTKSCCLKK